MTMLVAHRDNPTVMSGWASKTRSAWDRRCAGITVGVADDKALLTLEEIAGAGRAAAREAYGSLTRSVMSDAYCEADGWLRDHFHGYDNADPNDPDGRCERRRRDCFAHAYADEYESQASAALRRQAPRPVVAA